MRRNPTYGELERKVRQLEEEVSGRKLHEEALLIQKAYLEHLLDCAPEAIVLADRNHLISRTNAQFTRLFGYTPEESVGRICDDIIAPPDRLKEASDITLRVGDGDAIRVETVLCRKGGSPVFVEVMAAPVWVGGERVGGFYEPWVIGGVRLWFDAAACAFTSAGGFMHEKDWLAGLICAPAQHARFAVQDAELGICPEPLARWYPEYAGRINIRDCYCGEDCWMGPYLGQSCHRGLDINHPKGDPLRAPIDFDDQWLFNSVAGGQENNRWRGIRRWPPRPVPALARFLQLAS